MGRRLALTLLLFMFAVGASVIAGCAQRQVKVESGERVVCTYGEVVTDTVRVLEVPASEAARHSVRSSTVLCPRHKRLKELYDAAQDALRQGDTEAALRHLRELVGMDSAFADASSQLAAVERGETPTSSGDAPGRSNQPTDTGRVPLGPTEELARYVPDTLAGFLAEPTLVDPFSLTREYVPSDTARVLALVIAVERYKTAALARAGVDASIKKPYSAHASSVKVAGRSAYFGTDGKRYAVLAWNDGGILVALEMLSASGRPQDLRADLSAVATDILK